MNSPESDKYSIPFTILPRYSWMEKWKRIGLMKWWYISDHHGQIGLDMGTEGLYSITRRYSCDPDLFTIRFDRDIREES